MCIYDLRVIVVSSRFILCGNRHGTRQACWQRVVNDDVLPVVLGLQSFPLPDQVSSCLNIEELHLWVKFSQSVGHRCLLPRSRFPGDPQDRYNDNRCERMHTPVCVGYLCGVADCPGEWLS
jgi:hypothetical protein